MEMSWKDAIEKVLSESDGSMHYSDISEKIIEDGYKTKSGANPAGAVFTVMAGSIKTDGEKSPFIKVGKGVFALNPAMKKSDKKKTKKTSTIRTESEEPEIIVQASGLFWQRDMVQWKIVPKLFGRQFSGSDMTDFSNQRGIYILYDNHTPIYVGRATELPIGKRISDHTRDKLSGRWNRFSWFGLLEVDDNGVLSETKNKKYTQENFISALEAILIETLEPPRNMRIGDGFRACEYLQVKDPAFGELDKKRFLDDMFKQMSSYGHASDA
jgi:hypothetical protein